MPKKCDKCNQEFSAFGTTCSSCRKASNNNAWDHCTVCAKHFKGRGICPECKSLEAGEASDKVGRTCAACGHDIGYGEYISSGGLDYHRECFKCNQCGLKIDGPFKLDSDGKTMTCKTCIDKPVRDKENVNTINTGGKRRGYDRALESAPNDMSGSCAGCGNKLSGPSVECGGLKFHKECFTCEGCGTSLVGESVFQAANKRSCRACAEEAMVKVNSQTLGMCMKCGKALCGEYIVAEGQKFHTECFNCDRCGQMIDGPYKVEAAGGRYSLKVRNQTRNKFICKACS